MIHHGDRSGLQVCGADDVINARATMLRTSPTRDAGIVDPLRDAAHARSSSRPSGSHLVTATATRIGVAAVSAPLSATTRYPPGADGVRT